MAETDNAAGRYSRGAIFFHWAIAALIVANIAAAWVSEDLPKDAAGQVMANHKATGLLILGLTVLRIVWRLIHRPPPLSESLKAWEVALAKAVHGLFYVLMIGIPLAGWAMTSAFSGGQPISFFGLFTIPGLPFAPDKAKAGMFAEVHELGATLMLVLLALHLGATAKHVFIDRDGTLRRMLPWSPRG